MNQVTISPKENVTLLLVAVPKDATKFQAFDDEYSPMVLYRINKVVHTIDLSLPKENHPLYKMMAGSQVRNLIVIGVASTITEEQAKDLVKSERFNGFTYYSNYNDLGKVVLWAKYSLELLIESSGLTIGKDQDCLILKIN